MLAAEAQRADDGANRKQHYVYHLFYTWELARYTIVIASGLFVTSIINYGLLFNMEKLSGSIYLNSAFFGLFRWSMNITVGAIDYFVKCAGRKKIHFFALAFIAISIAIAFAIFAFKLTPDYQFLIRYCALAAAAMCSQLYLTKTVVMVELYPTAIRNIANSFMGLLSRFGNTLAPQIFYLGDYWKPLPYLTMMILALIDLSNFQLFIPETKGKPLKDHLPGPDECIWKRKKKPAIASTAATDKDETETKENTV
uniref:Solute carrier family 22 member 16 n=2 Tax=Ascaris TaxID=6251 RepID=F1LC34_ASCSU